MLAKNPPFLRRVYSVSFVFALNAALTAYINSTVLGNYVSQDRIGIIYAFAALLTLVGFEILPVILRRLGDKITTLLLAGIILYSLSALMRGTSANQIIFALVAYLTASNLTTLCFDIFIQHSSVEKTAGSTRGRYLTITNLAWMCAPFLAGVTITRFGYSGLYGLAFIFVAIVFVLVALGFKGFKDAKYERLSIWKALFFTKKHPNTTRIIIVNFILQFFYAWMIIYTPFYLHSHFGFDWKTIGIIFTVMLSPFVILQMPLGDLADKRLGEKELLIAGTIIMALATVGVGLYPGTNIIIWALILFMTRVGASMIEVMADTYFFKKVGADEPTVISLYRAMTPLAFLVAPIIGSLILGFSSFSTLFIILGVIVCIAIWPISLLKDTK